MIVKKLQKDKKSNKIPRPRRKRNRQPGQVGVQRGFFTMLQTCPTCNGEGRIIEVPCTVCHGQRIIRENNEVTLTIPEGVDTGRVVG